MDLSEKSTATSMALVCPALLTVSSLDQDRSTGAGYGGGGSGVENQLHSPARSMTSSSTSHDGSDATSAVGPVSGLEPSDVARSQNQVQHMCFYLLIYCEFTSPRQIS